MLSAYLLTFQPSGSFSCGRKRSAWGGEIDLPNNLFDKPLLVGVQGFSELLLIFYYSDAFPVALGTVVESGELGIHSSKKRYLTPR